MRKAAEMMPIRRCKADRMFECRPLVDPEPPHLRARWGSEQVAAARRLMHFKGLPCD